MVLLEENDTTDAKTASEDQTGMIQAFTGNYVRVVANYNPSVLHA